MVLPCRLITRQRSHMGLTEARTFIVHLPCRSCSPAAKRPPRKDAGSARSRRLRARLRTPRGGALQRPGECEMCGRWTSSTVSVRDPSPGEVVGGELDLDLVAREDADVVLA